MRPLLIIGIILVAWAANVPQLRGQSSARYNVVRSVMAGGGMIFSGSSRYQLGSTLGQPIIAGPNSVRFSINGGFWNVPAPYLSLIKSPTGSDLTLGDSWIGGTVPGMGNIATWSANSLGASLTLNNPMSWGGMMLLGGTSAIGINGSGPLTLGPVGIDMSASPVNLSLNLPVILGATQTWNVDAGQSLIIPGIIGGGFGLFKSGCGVLVLTNANSYTGGTTVYGGVLALGYNPGDTPTGTLAGGTTLAVNCGGTLRLDVQDALGYSGGLPAQLDINGGLVVSASVANTTPIQSGGTSFRVTLPTLNFTGGTLSSGTNNVGDLNGGNYLAGGAINTLASSNTVMISASSLSLLGTTFTVAAGTTPSGVDLYVSSILQNWGGNPESLTKSGSGLMILNNANSYTGGTIVNGGVLALDYNPGDNPTGTLAAGTTLTVNSGGILRLDGEDVLGFYGGSLAQLDINGGLVTSANVVYPTPVQYGGTSFRVTLPTVTFRGGTLSSGTNMLGDAYGGSYLVQGAVNTLASSNTAVINAHSVSLQNTTFTVASGTTPSGVDLDVSSILNNWVSGPQGLTKAGTGVMELDGVNTYTGTTTVSGGTLILMNGVLGSGGVNVGSSSVFLASGTVNGQILIQPGGAFGVAATIATLQLNNSLLLSGGGTTMMKINKNGDVPTADAVQNFSSVSFAGTLVVTNTTSDATPLALGDSFTLFPGSGSRISVFSNFILPALPSGLTWDVSGLLTPNGSISVVNHTPTPLFNPPTGLYFGGLTVTISDPDPGATIYYTTNGTIPTLGSPSGVGSVTVIVPAKTNLTIQAFATETDLNNSPVASAAYQTVGGTTAVWTNLLGGSWTNSANWQGGIIATGVDTIANFSTLNITANRTVTNSGIWTIGGLIFGDTVQDSNWTLTGGTNLLTVSAGSPDININVGQNTTISSALNGTQGFTQSGEGTLTLSGANTFTGAINVNAGTLALDYNVGDTTNGTLAGGSTLTVNSGGTLRLDKEDALGYYSGGPVQLNINGGLVTSANVANTTAVQNGGASFRVTLPTLTFTGGTLSSGTNMVGDIYGGSYLVQGAVNTLASSTTAVINAHSVSLQNTTFNVAAGSTPSGVDLSVASILNNWVSGPQSLTKAGSGVMVLSNANTYSGPTTINAGTLALAGSGSIANTTKIAIAGGAIFDVSGLSSPFVLGGGQTLSNSTSTAVFAGNASTGTGTLALNYSSGKSALAVTNGTLTLSSSTVFQINNIGSQLPVGNYALISTSAGGTVAGKVPTSAVTVGGGGTAASATLAIANGELNLVVGNNPVNTTPTNLMATVSGNTLNLSWPPDYLGWTLETNSVGLAAANQWFAYPGSATMTNVSIDIQVAKTNVFFRMVYP